MVAALEGGIWAPWAPGALGYGSNTQHFPCSWLKGELLPWNQDIGQLWAIFHKTPDFLLGTMGPAGGGTQNCSLRENIWIFWGFLPCSWEAIKSFFPSFGEEFGSCSVFPVCSLLSSQPALRSSRDAPMSLFHDNISFQAPAFAFWLEEVSVYSICSPCLLSVLSRLLWRHSEMVKWCFPA